MDIILPLLEEGYLKIKWVRIFPGTLCALVVIICTIIIMCLLSFKINILPSEP